jgi:hypothetical protein
VERLKRLFFVAVMALFTAVGILLLVAGEGDERWLGLMTVLFFGVGGSAYAFMPLLGRRTDPVHVGRVAHRGRDRPALVFPLVRSRLLLATVACLGFAGAGVIMASMAGTFADPGEDPGWPRFVGVACAVLGAGGAVAGIRGGAFGTTYFALTPDGILFRSPLGSSFVRWDAVTEAGLFEMSHNSFLGISVSDPAAVETTAPRWLQQANRSLSRWDLSLATSTLAVDASVLEATVRHYLRHPEARPELGTPASEARLGAAAEPP